MACLDDLVTATDKVANNTTGCGCGSGGAGGTSPPNSETDTGDITEPTGSPPSGYDNWGQYQVLKCDIADWIYSNMLADVQWLQTISLLTMTGGILALGVVSILSGATVIVAVAILGIIEAYGASILADLEDALENERDDLVCALFTGENAGDSIANFTSVVSDAIDAETTDVVARLFLKTLIDNWLDPAQINLLYATKDEVGGLQIPTGGDCSGCPTCTQFLLHAGTSDDPLLPTSFQSELAGGKHWIQVHFGQQTLGTQIHCGPPLEVSWSNVVGYTAVTGKDYREAWDWFGDGASDLDSNWDVLTDTVPTSGSTAQAANTTAFRSNSAFTLDLEVT